MKHKQFESYTSSGTANNITVGVLATIGLICGAKSFTGTQISLVEYCFIPSTLTLPDNRAKYCTPDKRYIMPESEFYAEAYAPANPEFQRDNFLPTKATRLRIIPPSNPNKPLWGLAAVVTTGGAFALSKAREWRLMQLLPSIRNELKANWLISKMREGLRLHKESYTAQLDYEFHQWSENRRARAAQLSNMTPQELAIFTEQVRLRAEAEARAQLQQASGQPRGALPGQSIEDITNPSDKVTGADSTQTIAPKDSWVQNLVKQTALIWGNQGGGKSWLARYVVKQKKQAGYRVIVLDPDSNRAEWRGVESYHSWDEIEQQIRNYVKELESRLKIFNNSTMSEEQWRQKLWTEGKALSLICEEATTYADFIKDAELLEKFGKLALTKSRKQEMPLTVVAHNNTQTCLFGIKGLHNLVSKMLQVECLAEVDPVTLQPKSTGRAKVKLDSSNEWLDVILPSLTAKISDFSDTVTPASNPIPPIDKATLERIYELEFNIGGKAGDTPNEKNKLSPMAQKLYEYLTRTERIEADVREFKGNFKVNGERFTVEQIKGWMYEIVGASLADWIGEGVIKLNQI
ncbi:ATP-binding protein (plasmid) [Anabaena sp. FACHB-709]|uniref:Helicase HerA central domain-containing protein n=3 Tax=Nostocaceae TaxID=1162 RepID=A0A1Z4KWZ4_ANAVA|nr:MULTISPECIES: ATP-binding protein [Nostocaceae]BAY73485.1 hypothetical protein NIES23_63370 [Trichormus variabilis NIES-23]MBD2174590.1 ATP-binding protein [Anabaena cylindrica FACHB-318]MBD2266359.1 ATP-binding protein [Anabaena sp. FACHB-709]MBD2275763.1 ATP-binding protein [Nostoc sp. PCC 7120 = FACHB-418]MBD2352793.1 ATP-binding protein [Trichormus variabilis FACHB-171]